LICSNRIYQQYIGVSLYSNDNKDIVPTTGIGAKSLGNFKDNTNHESKRMIRTGSGSGPAPAGGNIGFADGHLEWRKFKEMEHQVTRGMWFWW